MNKECIRFFEHRQMSDSDQSADGEGTGESLDNTDRRRETATSSRRRVLEAMTAGGTILLAGCGGSNPGTPTSGQNTPVDTDTPTATETTPTESSGLAHVSGQTFTTTIDEVPEEESFLSISSLIHLLFPTYNKAKLSPASVRLHRVIYETGVWADAVWPGNGGQTYYNWIEDPIEISPTEVTVNIQDNAVWSDEEPITGKDIAAIPLGQGLRRADPPFYASDKEMDPQISYNAIDGVEVNEKSVTYKSSAGHFEGFWDLDLRRRFGTWKGPHIMPTQIEPWTSYADAVVETANRAHAGEIDPWSNDSDPSKKTLVLEHLADPKWAKKLNKPENVPSTGVWDLVELQGTTKFVFEKNEHHRNVDRVNFDRLELINTPSGKREQAALQTDELDYASTIRGPRVPAGVADALPEHIERRRIPGGLDTGWEIAVNHDASPVDQRNIRAAIMYALDHEEVSNAIHPDVAVPITNPGGDCWDATQRVGSGWISNNLITYGHNPQKAASLMREAGYAKEGGTWVDSEGEPVTLSFPTDKSTPTYEPVVAAQLSDFGFESELNSLSGSAYWQRLPAGEFGIWNGTIQALTNFAPVTSLAWYHSISDRPFNIYSDEAYDQGEFSEDGFPIPRTEERWKVFTVEAPPVGEPNGELQTYHPASMSLSVYTNPPVQEYKERLKKELWLANWYLPTIPIAKELEQHFYDDAHWLWPRDTVDWNAYVEGKPKMRGGFFAQGLVQANPDNPEAGASVDE